MPSLGLNGLRQITWSEHLVRFAFGGAVTVATGLIAHAFGASFGGLFLAFPAILPASLTLLKQHDGRVQAVEAAKGARIGATTLVLFAAAAAWIAPRYGMFPALATASVLWVIAASALWYVLYARPTPGRTQVRLVWSAKQRNDIQGANTLRRAGSDRPRAVRRR